MLAPSGSEMPEMALLLDQSNQALGKEDKFLEEFQELLNETLSTIRAKRIVPTEVTTRVKEAQRLLLETLINRKSWKVTQRLLTEKETEERVKLVEALQSQTAKVEELRTPVLQVKKRPVISPLDGPEKNVLRQSNGGRRRTK